MNKLTRFNYTLVGVYLSLLFSIAIFYPVFIFGQDTTETKEQCRSRLINKREKEVADCWKGYDEVNKTELTQACATDMDPNKCLKDLQTVRKEKWNVASACVASVSRKFYQDFTYCVRLPSTPAKPTVDIPIKPSEEDDKTSFPEEDKPSSEEPIIVTPDSPKTPEEKEACKRDAGITFLNAKAGCEKIRPTPPEFISSVIICSDKLKSMILKCRIEAGGLDVRGFPKKPAVYTICLTTEARGNVNTFESRCRAVEDKKKNSEQEKYKEKVKEFNQCLIDANIKYDNEIKACEERLESVGNPCIPSGPFDRLKSLFLRS